MRQSQSRPPAGASPPPAQSAGTTGRATLYACDRCGVTDPQRMFALMSLWYAVAAGLAFSGGYFYLCPACYRSCIEPHEPRILQRLAEDHPHHRGPPGTSG